MSSPIRLLTVCTAVTLLMGCASERLAVTAPAGARLGGNWAIDTAASEDIGQAVAHLQAQIDKALHLQARNGSAGEFGGMRRRGGETGPDQGQQGPGQAPAGSDQVQQPTGQGPGGIGTGGHAAGAALVQEFLSYVPGNDLHIVVRPGTVSVTSENAAQTYATGVQTAVQLGEASAEQLAGWNDQRFVVDTQPDFGPALTLSYRVAANGELVVTVRLHDARLDTTLTRRYRRTNQAPAALLPSTD